MKSKPKGPKYRNLTSRVVWLATLLMLSGGCSSDPSTGSPSANACAAANAQRDLLLELLTQELQVGLGCERRAHIPLHSVDDGPRFVVRDVDADESII